MWHELLGLEPGGDPSVVGLGGPELRFVPGTVSLQWTVTLRRAGIVTPRADLIPGVTFRYAGG
jgi:hypothetical protein